ncbi:MAG TPA: hypothetical protein PLU72_00655 [Candidatus Ozemobacteraceae bacterium]|nr:hypothetical protein [Candidatus Ozemobacteraceae bacterium]
MKSKMTRAAGLFLAVIALISLTLCTGCGNKQPAAGPAAPKIDRFGAADGLPHDVITALAVFGNQIWVGTKSGVARYDGVNWQVHVTKNTNSLGSNEITSLAAAGSYILIGTDNGVTRYDGKNWGQVMSGSRARSVAAKDAQMAVATAHGLEYSTGGQFQAFGKENAGLTSDEATTVGFDGKGNVWVGLQLGMAQLNGQMFINHSGPAKTVMGNSLVDVKANPPTCQLIGNNITTIVPYKGMMAIGTTSGVSITDMGMAWTNYNAAHKEWVQRGNNIVEETMPGNSPLPGNLVTSLAVLPGDAGLVIGTNRGVAVLRDATWVDLEGKLSDIKSNQITALAIQGAHLWVGTQNGLYRVRDFLSLIGAEGTK